MSKLRLAALAAAPLALGALPGSASAGHRAETGEQRLARLLEGRVAGEPRDCIDLQRIRGSRIIDDTAIVYDAGSTLWVNRPRGGAEILDRRDVMVTRPFGTRLCSIDTVDLIDSGARFPRGFVSLGAFVPYRKPARD